MSQGFQCTACGLRFTSLSGFEAHRRGRMTNTPPHYGRDCLSMAALREREFRVDAKGRWVMPPSEEKREFGRLQAAETPYAAGRAGT